MAVPLDQRKESAGSSGRRQREIRTESRRTSERKEREGDEDGEGHNHQAASIITNQNPNSHTPHTPQYLLASVPEGN